MFSDLLSVAYTQKIGRSNLRAESTRGGAWFKLTLVFCLAFFSTLLAIRRYDLVFYPGSAFSTTNYTPVTALESFWSGWIYNALSSESAPALAQATKTMSTDALNTPISKTQVEEMIQDSILRQTKDTISLRDYALGALHVPNLTTYTPTPLSIKQRLGARFLSNIFSLDLESHIGKQPSKALNDKLEEGHCWEFHGPYGHLGIALKDRITIEKVSIDHIPRELASDHAIQQAPRKMILWGKVAGGRNLALVQAYWREVEARRPFSIPLPSRPRGLSNSKDVYLPLTEFEYRLSPSSKPHIQTAPVPSFLRSFDIDFDVVVLEILSNWGSSSTCLYRVRIHGFPVKSLALY